MCLPLHQHLLNTYIEKDLGSIEPSELAHMVVVEGNPLQNIQDAWNVITVIKNGEPHSIDKLLKILK